MKLPHLRKTVKIKFWSLRAGLGPNLGVIPDIDTEIEREAYRVKTDDGWKWQIKGMNEIGKYDPSVYTDQDVLDEYGLDIKVKILTEQPAQAEPHKAAASLAVTLGQKI